jgi:hypothetical protein
MSRNEPVRTEIEIEAGPASGAPRPRRSAGLAIAAIVAIGAFLSGYATRAGPHHDTPTASPPAVASAPNNTPSAAPLTLPPDSGGSDAAVFLGPYPRALSPACDASPAPSDPRDTE